MANNFSYFDMIEKRLKNGLSINSLQKTDSVIGKRLILVLEAHRLCLSYPNVNIRHTLSIIDKIWNVRNRLKHELSEDIAFYNELLLIYGSTPLPRPLIPNNTHDRIRNKIRYYSELIEKAKTPDNGLSRNDIRNAIIYATEKEKDAIRYIRDHKKASKKKDESETNKIRQTTRKRCANLLGQVRDKNAKKRKIRSEKEIREIYESTCDNPQQKIPIEEYRKAQEVLSKRRSVIAKETKLAIEASTDTIVHKIRLSLNNKQQQYLQKCFKVSRFCYNWAIRQWLEARAKGENLFADDLQHRFVQVNKKEYPFTYEVTAKAKFSGFRSFHAAQNHYFYTGNMPRFKTKKLGLGSMSFSVGIRKDPFISDRNLDRSDSVPSKKRQYVNIPGLGYVKMMEKLRFEGIPTSATVKQESDGHYYICIKVHTNKAELARTHPYYETTETPTGIDLGLKDAAILSNGIKIKNREKPTYLLKRQRRLQESVNRSKEAWIKKQGETEEKVPISKNQQRKAWKLAKTKARIRHIREDFLHKTTTTLAYHCKNICMEHLNVKDMMNNGIARKVEDASFYTFRMLMEQKAAIANHSIHIADRFFPSTRTCSACGCVQDKLKITERTFVCRDCGCIMDRDLNAAINLAKLIGLGEPEFKSEEIDKLIAILQKNGIDACQVETESR